MVNMDKSEKQQKGMILILTTLFHLLATIPPFTSTHPFRYPYMSMVVATTFLSAIWHLKGQPEGLLLYLDYSFTAIWFFYDMGLICNLPNIDKAKIITASFSVLCLHEVCSAEENYAVYHSLWHIASAVKCLYVSFNIFTADP